MLERTRLVPVDASFVVFGSLARDELTAGSDLDWTLLIDGQAAPEHVTSAQSIAVEVATFEQKKAGITGLFEGLAFSHDLIHGKLRVPRFLLNDIVRFWRTLTVDYAAKRRDREWKGWALRNFKLRMSRKLIFVAGLTMCLRCQLKTSAPTGLEGLEALAPIDFYAALQEFLIEFSNRSPLDILAEFATSFGASELAGRLLDAYDEFLGILMDQDKRTRLDEMDFDVALKDPLFAEARLIGSSFRDALIELFFKTNDELTALTQRHGVSCFGARAEQVPHDEGVGDRDRALAVYRSRLAGHPASRCDRRCGVLARLRFTAVHREYGQAQAVGAHRRGAGPAL